MLAGYLKKPLAAPNIFASFLLCLLQDIMKFVACDVLSPSFRKWELLNDIHNRLCDSKYEHLYAQLICKYSKDDYLDT